MLSSDIWCYDNRITLVTASPCVCVITAIVLLSFVKDHNSMIHAAKPSSGIEAALIVSCPICSLYIQFSS